MPAPNEKWTPPESTRVNPKPVDDTDPSAVERAGEKVSAFRRALQVQPEDTRAQAFGKIAATAGLAILLLVVSPLIIFGLFTGLAVAA